MYKTKMELLKKQFREDSCFSALITVGLDSVIAGTPVMASINPFNNVVEPSNKLTFAKAVSLRDDAPDRPGRPRPVGDRYARNNYAPTRPKNTEIKKVTAKDLYEMDTSKANELLHNSGIRANVMFPFSFFEDMRDYYIHKMHGNQLYFDGKKPLVFDEGHNLELERLSDVHSKSDIKSFVEIVNNSLKSNRYLTYVFNGVAASNKKYMLEDINTIFNSLKKFYPKNVSFFRTPIGSSGLRCLIDTISVSFYRIGDMIAIFDSKKASGIGAEIFLTNSIHNSSDIQREGHSATYRFLFSEFRENLFSIDGELIKRRGDRNTGEVLSMASSTISRGVPNDEKLKKEKPKTVSA